MAEENEFVRLRKMEQERSMATSIKVILEKLYKFEETLTLLKKGQVDIREDLRNLDKLRALRNK